MAKDKLKTVTNKDLERWVEGKTFELIEYSGYERCAVVKLLTPQYKDLVVVFDDIRIRREEGEELPRLTYEFLLPELSAKDLPRYQNSNRFKEAISAVLTTAINTHLEVVNNLPPE